MRHVWVTELWGFAIAVLLPLAAGWLARYPYAGLAAGLAAYLAWHLFRLARLSRKLSGENALATPRFSGLWQPVFEDIDKLQSRSRKRKQRLARFMRRFREAATAFPDAAVILGRRGQVQWSNPAASRLIGLAWPGAAGKILTQLVKDPILAEYLAAGDYSRAVVLASPVSKGRLLSVQVTPFRKKHQRLLIARDITATYNLDRVRRDFVANVSHELRTPLTVITGFLESLAEQGEPDHERPRAMALMREQAVRMEELIGDLLTLSRLELQDEVSESKPVAVSDLLESVVCDARRVSGARAHSIELDTDPDLQVRGRDAELRSAISNLVLNAVRHTPDRTRIQVEWSPHEGGALLRVRDNGPGIPARHIPRLTERFYRVDESRSRDTGGTGLGLAIVKHVLDRHDGQLSIESAVGKGSSFMCVFPPHAVVTRSEAGGPPPPGGQN